MSEQPDPYGYATSAPTQDERQWALAAHLGSFAAAYVALGLLAPLLVLLTKGNRSPYIRRHAVESLNFNLTVLIWIVTGSVIAVVTLGLALLVLIPLGCLLAVYYLVTVIIASVKAWNGEDFRYPLIWRFVS